MSNERVVCAACGSNNFATQAACWKCGKVLSAPPPVAAPAPMSAVPAGAPPLARPLPAPDLRSESPAAFWSSVAMGVLFPMLAIPVGLVFLMLDDRRKHQIGWWNILFGLVGTLLNGVIAVVSLYPLFMNATRLIPNLGGARAGQSQDLNAEAPPLDLPGQRPFAAPPR